MLDHLKYYKKIKSIPTVNLGDLDEKNFIQAKKKFYFNLA